MSKKGISKLGKHLSLGGLVGHTASIIGSTAKATVKGGAYASSFMIKDAAKREQIRSQAEILGAQLDKHVTVGGKAVGKALNKSIQIGAATAGRGSGKLAELAGASPEKVKTAEQCGAFAVTAVASAAAGICVMHAAIGAAAAAGTVGAAATTSGLAALGGGSIASGGGGMAVGLISSAGITTGSAFSVYAATLEDDDDNDKESAVSSDSSQT